MRLNNWLKMKSIAEYDFSDALTEDLLVALQKMSTRSPGNGELPVGYLYPKSRHIVFDNNNYSLMQRMYLDTDWQLRPSICFLHKSGELYFQINEIGLKGSAMDNSRKRVVVWGDSVVFGIGRGWVDFASDDATLFLNGGAEGSPAEAIITNALKKNSLNNFNFNIVSLGWHSKHDLGTVRNCLNRSLSLPNLALMTLPYSISPQLAKKDLTKEFTNSDNVDESYLFWGNTKYSIKSAKKLVRDIRRQNNIMRTFAKRKRLPLLDLERILASERSPNNFKRSFFDLGHPRPSLYPFLTHLLRDFVRIHS